MDMTERRVCIPNCPFLHSQVKVLLVFVRFYISVLLPVQEQK